MKHLKLVLAAFLMPCAVAAQDPQGDVADSSVSFDFQGADIRAIISTLADVAGLNITYGDLPNRTVTLRTGQPVLVSQVRALLETLVRANGLELFEEGGLVRIEAAPGTEPAAAAGQMFVSETAPPVRRLYVHQLRHAKADRLVQTLGALFSTGGAPAAEAGFDASLSQALQQQRDAPFEQQDQPGAPAPAAAAGFAVGLQAPVDMVPDPATNSILVLATQTDYGVISNAIQQLDVRPLQVMIEVIIAEVRHSSAHDLGIDIDIPLEVGDEDGVTFNLHGFSAGDVALQILGIGNVKADVILRALATKADVSIVSRPVILAQNNQEARILVGDQRPFIQLQRALPTENAVRDQIVQYRNVGTQLSILPTISPDGYVNLVVAQEVSTATAETQFGAPIINTREVETELLVQDGHTVVLGGLISRQKETTNSGIPLLKDIPLLGLLFRSTATRTVATELLLMLTPHVIWTDEDMEATTRGVREALGSVSKALPDSLPLFDLHGAAPDSVIQLPRDTTRSQDAASRPDSTRVRR